MPTDLLYTAIGMKDYLPLNSSDRAGVLSLNVQPPKSALRCPGCKATDVIRRGTIDRKVYAPPIGLRATLITIETPKVECRQCGCVRTIELPKVVPSKNPTKSFARLAIDLRKLMTIADVALYLGVSDSMIRGIDKLYLGRKFSKPKLGHLKYLAMDEISVRKGHKYLTMVMDLVSGAVVFVGDGKGEKSLEPFWKRLRGSRAKIKAVATDMSSAYFKAVQENLPNVSHVFDRFHIVKLMNDKLTARRRELHRQATDGPEKLSLKGTRWLLLKNPQNLDADRDEHQRLEDALQLNQSLSIAYYLKEDLQQIWEQPSKREAGKFVTDWCAGALASGISQLKTMAKTISKHRKGILAWYDHPISTGPLEGLNNKIKTLKRQAYGFRDVAYFKLNIYAIHLAKFELIG